MQDLFSVSWKVNKNFYTQYNDEVLSKIPEPDEGVLLKYAGQDRRILSQMLVSRLNVVFYESDTGISLGILDDSVILSYNSDVIMSFEFYVCECDVRERAVVTVNKDFFDVNSANYTMCPEELRHAFQIINYLGLAVLRGDYVLIYEQASKTNTTLKLPIADQSVVRETIFKYIANSKALRDLGSASVAECSEKNVGIMMTYRSDKSEKFTEEFSRRIYCDTIISENGDIGIAIYMDNIMREEPYLIQYRNTPHEPQLNISGLLRLDGIIAALESTDSISDYAQCYMYICDYLQYLGILETYNDGVRPRAYIKTVTV